MSKQFGIKYKIWQSNQTMNFRNNKYSVDVVSTYCDFCNQANFSSFKLNFTWILHTYVRNRLVENLKKS